MDKDKIKALCRSCQRETNHAILAEHNTSGHVYDDDIQWWGKYQIIQCLGCNDIGFRHASTCTEDFDPRTGNLVESVRLYPNPAAGRQPIDGHENFPRKTSRIYLETLNALNNQTPILAAIGLRALIESICLQQETKANKLATRIDELANMGLLSMKQAQFLHNHRFMGNEAAHEVVGPKPQHLIAALDIAETLLKTIYILPYMADGIKKTSTPSST